MALKILRASQAQEATGLPRSCFYSQVAKGLLPPSIQLGPRSVGWVETEINAVNVARILGKTDEEIKSLVMRLVKERVHLAEGAANV